MRNIADKVSNKKIKEDYGIDMQRTLHLIRGHDLVGTIIAEAVKRGEFDNLEGTGKPLNLDDNPFAPDEMHMAYKILKDNGYAPHWIELGKEIDAFWVKFSEDVEYFKKYTRVILGEKPSAAAIHRYEPKKNDFYTKSRERLVEISKKILDYNLHCPVSQLGRANFDVNEKMSSIIADIEESLQEFKRSV